jgi:hypothetical protein
MQTGHRWRDVIEEVAGRSTERTPSPWDGLYITGGPMEGERISISPDDVDLTTNVGTIEGSRPLSMPVVMTDNSGGQLSAHGRLAMVQAAARTGCALRLADPTPDFLELVRELDIVFWAVVGPDRHPSILEALELASVVEFQLAYVDADGNARSPVDTWDSGGSLEPTVSTIRSVAGDAPLVVNLGAISHRDTIKAALTSGADGVMVQSLSRTSALHGRLVGSGPLDSVAMMRRAKGRTKREKGASDPLLVVSGGFKDGVEVAKALALGADMVVIGTAVRMALGCTLCGECGPGECPKKVLGQETTIEVGGADWRAEADGLVDYLGRLSRATKTTLAQMGCATAAEATLDRLEARSYDVAARTGAALAGYGEPLPMWLH